MNSRFRHARLANRGQPDPGPGPGPGPGGAIAELARERCARGGAEVDGTFDVSGTPGRITEGPDGNVWFKCSIEKRGRKADYSSCRSPETYRLKPGGYEFAVKAKAGGVTGKPAKAKFKVVKG